jgi:cytochrome c
MNRSTGPISATSCLALAALLSAGVAAPAAAADDGQLSYNSHCRTCHSTDEGDHRQGPSLHQIFGAKAGSSDYPNFSSSLSNSGLTWDEKTLDRLIANPEQLIPGNNMKPYSGISDKAEREKIVEFLKSEAG